MTDETYSAMMRYLERLGRAEYEAQLRAHLKAGRRRSTMRYCPSQYHIDLIDALQRDDEEAFKAIKGLRGYASEVGH